MRVKPVAWVFLLCVYSGLLGGCSIGQKHYSHSIGRRVTDAQNLWRWQEGYGFRQPAMAPSITQAYSQDDSIEGIWQKILFVSPLRGYPLRVSIVPNSQINATTDGKSVLIYSGLLNVFGNNQNAIANVLAHELGHILANHHMESNAGWANFLPYLTPGLAFVPYGGWASLGINETMQMGRKAYSRYQENEADAIGVFLAMEAGFQARGLSEYLNYASPGSGFGRPSNVSIPTSLGAIPQSATSMLLSTTPLYRDHPPSKKRKKIVELMLSRRSGQISQDQLAKEQKWLAELYNVMEKRIPKDR